MTSYPVFNSISRSADFTGLLVDIDKWFNEALKVTSCNKVGKQFPYTHRKHTVPYTHLNTMNYHGLKMLRHFYLFYFILTHFLQFSMRVTSIYKHNIQLSLPFGFSRLLGFSLLFHHVLKVRLPCLLPLSVIH